MTLPSSLIQNLDAFKGLPPAALGDVLAEARLRKAAAGACVFTQGSPSLRFFLLLDGQLKIVQLTEGGQQVILHLVAPGQMFGLAAAVGRDEYPGSAVAVVDSTVLVWPVGAWDRLASRYPALAASALRLVGAHLQDAFARLREVASARVEQRIARTLLRMVRQSGRRTADGVEIDFPITRREIAEMASTTLHTVSRTLSGWEHSGVLTGGRRRIVVLDPHALVRIAHEEGRHEG